MEFQKVLEFILLQKKDEKLINFIQEFLETFQPEDQKLFDKERNMQMWIITMSQILKDTQNIQILKKMECVFTNVNLNEQCSFLFQSYYINKMNYLYKKNLEDKFIDSFDLFLYSQVFGFQNLPGILSFLMKILNNEYFTSKKCLLKSSMILKRFVTYFSNQNQEILKEINKQMLIYNFKQYKAVTEEEDLTYKKHTEVLQNQILLFQKVQKNISQIKNLSKKVIISYLKTFQNLHNVFNEHLEHFIALHQNIFSLQIEYLNQFHSLSDITLDKQCIQQTKKNITSTQKTYCNQYIQQYIESLVQGKIKIQELKTLKFLIQMNHNNINFDRCSQKRFFKKIKNILSINFQEEFNLLEETIYFSQFKILTVKQLLSYQDNIQNKFFKDYLIFSQKYFNQTEIIKQVLTAIIYQDPGFYLQSINNDLQELIIKKNHQCFFQDSYIIMLINYLITFKKYKILENLQNDININFKLLQQLQSHILQQKFCVKNKTLYKINIQMSFMIQANLIRNYKILDNLQIQYIYNVTGNLDKNLNLTRTYLYCFIQYILSIQRDNQSQIKQRKLDIIKQIFQKNFENFIFHMTISLPQKTQFILKFMCNYTTLVLNQNEKFFDKKQIFMFYDFLLQFYTKNVIQTIETYRDFIFFIQKTIKFFSVNFVEYQELFDFYQKEENFKNLPSNFFRRIVLDLFYTSQKYYVQNISIISEIIYTFNLSFDLLYEKPIIKEANNQLLSENENDNVETVNAFGSMIYELKDKINQFISMYPQWLIQNCENLQKFYESQKGYNQEIKAIQKVRDENLKLFDEQSAKIILESLKNYKQIYIKNQWQNQNLHKYQAPYFRIFHEIIDLFVICINNDEMILNCLKEQLNLLPTYFFIISIFDQNNFDDQKLPLYNNLVYLIKKLHKQDYFVDLQKTEFYTKKNYTF